MGIITDTATDMDMSVDGEKKNDLPFWVCSEILRIKGSNLFYGGNEW